MEYLHRVRGRGPGYRSKRTIAEHLDVDSRRRHLRLDEIASSERESTNQRDESESFRRRHPVVDTMLKGTG